MSVLSPKYLTNLTNYYKSRHLLNAPGGGTSIETKKTDRQLLDFFWKSVNTRMSSLTKETTIKSGKRRNIYKTKLVNTCQMAYKPCSISILQKSPLPCLPITLVQREHVKACGRCLRAAVEPHHTPACTVSLAFSMPGDLKSRGAKRSATTLNISKVVIPVHVHCRRSSSNSSTIISEGTKFDLFAVCALAVHSGTCFNQTCVIRQ